MKTRRRKLRLWLHAFLASAALMTFVAAATVGCFTAYVGTLPPIEQLEYYDPPTVSRVLDRWGLETIGEFKEQRRYVTPIEQIPTRLQQAFLAIEDGRFYRHFGVDPIGVLRAMVVNFKAGGIVEGASTITMQLTRNVLPEVGTEKKIERKIKEAVLALQIERRYSKDQILEFYLNHIEFVYNSFGVRAAASTFFSKELDELTIAECATLAAMPKNPRLFNPILYPQRARTRRDIVLDRMHDLDMITDDEYAQARAEPMDARFGLANPSDYPYFLDALHKDLIRHYGVREDTLRRDGLRITSTIEPRVQQACVTALRDGLVNAEREWHKAKYARFLEDTKEWNGALSAGQTVLMKIDEVADQWIKVRLNDYFGDLPLPDPLPYYEPANILQKGNWIDVRIDSVDRRSGSIEGVIDDQRPIQGAIVVLDARTGEVLALVGGDNFYDENRGGNWNRAVQGGRQPGSCLKPFFFAAALDRGFQPNEMIVDEPVAYPTLPGQKPYQPVNYEKAFFGPTTLIEALEHSRNVVTIRLFEAMGLKRALEFVRLFDFTQQQSRWSLPPEISICLGTIDVTPFEMAAAYQVFANQGVAVRPQFFRNATQKTGRVALPVRYEEEPLIDPIVAYQMQYILRQAVTRGTGQSTIGSRFASPPYPPIAGKTGTTNDCRDAWFAGFTPELVIVVQVGFDRPRPMGPRMTGSKVAGPIWADAFERVFETRSSWKMSFDVPNGVEFADICGWSGQRTSDLCHRWDHTIYRNVPFPRGAAPAQTCAAGRRTPLILPVGDQWADLGVNAPIIGIASKPLPKEGELPGYPFTPPSPVSERPAVPFF